MKFGRQNDHRVSKILHSEIDIVDVFINIFHGKDYLPTAVWRSLGEYTRICSEQMYEKGKELTGTHNNEKRELFHWLLFQLQPLHRYKLVKLIYFLNKYICRLIDVLGWLTDQRHTGRNKYYVITIFRYTQHIKKTKSAASDRWRDFVIMVKNQPPKSFQILWEDTKNLLSWRLC